ncbi:hypothetical protein [Actinomadura sp. 6N118]|uniref:hypothetical protein n=1 Tax=Actinomadura sp. 6N118 TaxID=3375151 RepID=UPI0037A7CE2F
MIPGDLADRPGHPSRLAAVRPLKRTNRIPSIAATGPPNCWAKPMSRRPRRGPGERSNAQLKSWRILRKLRCSQSKAGHLVKVIAVLQNHLAAHAARE